MLVIPYSGYNGMIISVIVVYVLVVVSALS